MFLDKQRRVANILAGIIDYDQKEEGNYSYIVQAGRNNYGTLLVHLDTSDFSIINGQKGPLIYA